MYRAAPGTELSRVRDKLRELAQSGQIEIGLSYHIVFELLQKAQPQFREDRLARARLLTELCGRNAFPYPTDLGRGERFSTEGLWMPRVDLEEVEIEPIVKHMMDELMRRAEFNRHQRRVFSKQKYFARWVADNQVNIMQLAEVVWPLRFGRSFVESGDFSLYLLARLLGKRQTRNCDFISLIP
jgi:hypothetical protein